MSHVFKQLIRKKMREITPNELLNHAKEYRINLSETQAIQISNTIREQKLDPFKKENLVKLFNQLEEITDKDTVKKAKVILNQFIKQYNIADWFN